MDAPTALREVAGLWEQRYPKASPAVVRTTKEGLIGAVSRARAAELRKLADQIEGSN
jgi:hypothetical protein